MTERMPRPTSRSCTARPAPRRSTSAASRSSRRRPPGSTTTGSCACSRNGSRWRRATGRRSACVPGHLANPVWVDDPRFDITYHVRRSALPRPGTDAQLLEFCARIQSRLLDRARPLWEMYLVEGLADGRVAIADEDPRGDGRRARRHRHRAGDPRRRARTAAHGRARSGCPSREPSSLELVRERARRVVRRPLGLTDTVRGGVARRRRPRSRGSPSLAGGVASAATARLRRARRRRRCTPARRAAPPGRRADPARRLPAGARRVRRDGQRRRAGRRRRRAARLAALPRRAAAAGERRCARWCR